MGFFSKSLGKISDSTLIGIACISADIGCFLNSIGISRKTATRNTTARQADSIFFAHGDLNQLKESLLPHIESIEAQIIASRVNLHTAPFEQWIPEDILGSIKVQFEMLIRNTHNGTVANFLNEQLSPNNSDCQKVFSIPSETERKDAIEAYRTIIEKRSCEQFAMLCDGAITDLLPQLLRAAEQVLSDKQSEQVQRDLDREKLLVTRAKLTMLEDYINTKT